MCAFCVYKREKRFGAKNKNNIISKEISKTNFGL